MRRHIYFYFFFFKGEKIVNSEVDIIRYEALNEPACMCLVKIRRKIFLLARDISYYFFAKLNLEQFWYYGLGAFAYWMNKSIKTKTKK